MRTQAVLGLQLLTKMPHALTCLQHCRIIKKTTCKLHLPVEEAGSKQDYDQGTSTVCIKFILKCAHIV